MKNSATHIEEEVREAALLARPAHLGEEDAGAGGVVPAQHPQHLEEEHRRKAIRRTER